MHWITAFAVGLIVSSYSYACDVCGGIAPPGTIGFTPGNNYHFIGVRTNFRHYASQEVSQFDGSVRNSQEYFLQGELTARMALSTRFHIITSLPYSAARQTAQNGHSGMNGLGDFSLGGIFSPIQTLDPNGEQVHQMNVGGTIKFPTGKYALNAHSMSNLYPGTGSFDAQLLFSHLFNLKRIGWQSELSYSFRTENKYGYRYGNSFSGNFHQYINLSGEKLILRLFIGLGCSSFGKDRLNGSPVDESVNDGWQIGLRMGVNVVVSNWFLSGHAHIPVAQELGDGSVKQKESIQLSIIYLIQRKKR